MYQFTTPLITITIPEELPVSTIDKLVVTLKQASLKIEKAETEVTFDTENNKINVHLSQEETGLFGPGSVQVQVHILVGNTAYATNIMTANIYANIHGEVIA